MRLENLSHHIVYALFPPDALMFIRLFLTPGEVEVPRFSSNTTLGMLRQLKFVHLNNSFLRQLHQKESKMFRTDSLSENSDFIFD